MKSLKFVAILAVVVFIGIAVYACAPAPAPTPTPTPAPTLTPPPSGYETYTYAEEGKGFSIYYPSDWVEDSASKAEIHDLLKERKVAGFTMKGGCFAFFRSPDTDAHLLVHMMSLPLSVKVDTIFANQSWTEGWPGYVEISHEIIDTEKLEMIHIFTYDNNKAKQLIEVKSKPSQVWYVSVVATEESFCDYESQFDRILESFILEGST